MLLNRLPLVPQETMVSYLERLRMGNYYTGQHWYAELGLTPVENPNRWVIRAGDSRLTDLTGVLHRDLVQMTIHSLVPYYFAPTDLLPHDRTIYPMLRYGGPYKHRHPYLRERWFALCPRCWSDCQAVIWPWYQRHITTCPHHHLLLVDHCPGCGQRLRLDMATGRCARCRTSIAAFPTRSLQDHPASMLLADVIGSLLAYPTPSVPAAYAARSPDHPVHQLHAAHVLDFIWHMAHLLRRYDPAHPLILQARHELGYDQPLSTARFEHVPLIARHMLMSVATTLLLHWPEGWYELLERIAAHERTGSHGIPYSFPRALWHTFPERTWDWLHAFGAACMLAHTTAAWPGRSQSGWRVILHEARTDLRSPPMVPQTAGESGHGIAAGPDPRYCTLTQAATRYGLTPHHMRSLITAGWLDEVEGSLDDPSAPWMLRSASVQAALGNLLQRLPRPPGAELSPLLSFPQVVPILDAHAISVARVVLDIHRMHLAAFRQGTALSFASLVVEADAFTAYVQAQTAAHPDDLWTLPQVLAYLGATPILLRYLFGYGLLMPVRERVTEGITSWCYAPAEVTAWSRQYLELVQAALLLAVSRFTMHRWCLADEVPMAFGVPPLDTDDAHLFFGRNQSDAGR
jgi:hypothetical protein